MSLWFSSGVFKSRKVSEVLAEAKQIGISNIELSSGLDYDENWMQSVTVASAINDQKFLIHNYFPAPKDPFVLNIGSLHLEGLKRSKSFAHDALEYSKKIGSSYYSIHAGFAAALKPEHLGDPAKLASYLTADDIDREASYRIMIETLQQLADHANQLGLNILVENNVISPFFLEKLPVNPLLLTSAQEITEFFRDIERDNIGLLLDVAHVNVSATALNFSKHEFVEEVSPYTRCLHLSENDGCVDSNQPVNQTSWFLPHLAPLKHCDMVLEAYRLERDTLLSQQDLLNEVINA